MLRSRRIIITSILLGVATTVASVPLIAYWPRTNYPTRFQLDRDRRPEAGEGRGYLALRYEEGFGYSLASGWAAQQMIFGGYNYASNTSQMPWPQTVEHRVAPWAQGDKPWPADGESHQYMLLRVGWPFAAADGLWHQLLQRPRPPRPSPGDAPPDPPEPVNVVTTTNWREAQAMWSPYGGWAYIKSPTWLKTSRLGQAIFNKSNLPAVPTRPLWLGIAADTALFAAAWWGAIAGVGSLRRRYKDARTAGRCEHCRYPRAGLDHDAPCPECGKRPGRDSNPRPAV